MAMSGRLQLHRLIHPLRRKRHGPVIVDMKNVHAVIHEVYVDANVPCPYCTGEYPLKEVV